MKYQQTFDLHFQLLHRFSVEILLFTYYNNPQDTADHKHKVSAAIKFWQCFLKEEIDRNRYDTATTEIVILICLFVCV